MRLNDRAVTHAAIRRYMRQYEPQVQKAWVKSVRQRRRMVDESFAEAILLTGRTPNTLLETLRRPLEDFVTDSLTPAWVDGLTAGGNTFSASMRLIRAGKSFTSAGKYTPTNVYAAEWLKDRGGQLIKEWLAMDASLLSTIVAQNTIEKPMTIYELAETIKESLGLTARQYGWIDNRYDKVLSSLLSEGYTQAQAEKAADRDRRTYTYWLQQGRAQTVARTETSAAFNYGQLSAMQEAQENGWLAHTVKVWSAAPDCCEECAEMDGEELELEQAFEHSNFRSEEYTSGLTPPLHPNCRCVLAYETRE